MVLGGTNKESNKTEIMQNSQTENNITCVCLCVGQVVWILHSIFPAYMNGCRSLGGHLYVDVDQQTREMLLALRAGHQVRRDDAWLLFFFFVFVNSVVAVVLVFCCAFWCLFFCVVVVFVLSVLSFLSVLSVCLPLCLSS